MAPETSVHFARSRLRIRETLKILLREWRMRYRHYKRFAAEWQRNFGAGSSANHESSGLTQLSVELDGTLEEGLDHADVGLEVRGDSDGRELRGAGRQGEG